MRSHTTQKKITDLEEAGAVAYCYLGLFINPKTRDFFFLGNRIALGNREFLLMYGLLKQPECVHTREKLLEELDTSIHTRTVDATIKTIRSKLQKSAGTDVQVIIPVYKLGYRLWRRGDL